MEMIWVEKAHGFHMSCNPFLVSLGYASATTEIELVYSKAKTLAWLTETPFLARALIPNVCGKATWRDAIYFGNEASSLEWSIAIFPRDVAIHLPVPQLHAIQALTENVWEQPC